MDFNEKIFHWVWKKKKNFLTSKPHESSVSLKENSHRFSLVAFALAGEILDISVAEGVGGFIGNKLYLPRNMSVAHDRESNLTAYFYRIAYSIFSRQLGFVQADENHARRRIADYLIISSVEKKIQSELPGLWKKIPKMKEMILQSRPRVQAVPQDLRLSEVLNRYYLGDSNSYSQILTQEEALLYKWMTQDKIVGTIPASEFVCFKRDGILPLWGRIALHSSSDAIVESLPDHTSADALPEGTEKEKAPTEGAHLVKYDDENPEQMPVNLVIEQLKTLEKFLGGKKTADASDELEEHSEALEEVDVREVFRSKKQAQSIFRSDLSMSQADVQVDEEIVGEGKSYLYDEWDYRKKRYWRNWCRIREKKVAKLKERTLIRDEMSALKKSYHKEIKQVRTWMESLLLSRSWKTRQTEGAEIDVDQMIDRHASLKSGHTPSEALYIDRRKSVQDLAILVLLDASLSTGSWIDGRQVMATSKEAVFILHEALLNMSGNVALAGFYSSTRTNCSFIPLKDFKEKWDLKTQQRLLSLEPSGYTRIGPALRHAIHCMENQSASRRAVLLITDGKPSDYDAYEGKHGIEDVRQAVVEANQKNIGVFSLAVDQRARTYFPRMFGQAHFSVIKHPRDLPMKLMKWYSQLLLGV